jgi:hypothetical protein
MAQSLVKALSERTLESRSDLYRWLHSHHKELAPVLSVPRPKWRVLAGLIGERWGSAPPTGNAVRAAWLRLEKDMAPKRPTPSRSATAAPAGRVANAPRPIAPPARKPGDKDDFAELRAGLASSSRKPPEPL